MSVRQRLRSDESGVTLILVTLVFVLLLGFAAFAVDAAAARSQRRQNQTATDTGALSAIQEARDVLRAAAVANATNEVIRITYASMTPDMTFAEWQTAWGSCTDADKPAEFFLSGSSDCVSFNRGLLEMRVRLPTIDVDTTFGQVLGRNTISTGAVVVVSVDLNPIRTTIFPFAIPGGVADRTHLCLTTADDPGYLDPCDAPEDEQLSFVDVTEFGYPPFGSNPCGASEGTRIERNLIRGFDHAVTSAPFAGAPAWLDQALCNDGNYSSRPYTLNIEEGDGHKFDLDDGLIDGNLEDGSWDSNGQLAGRLSRGSNRINIEIYRPDDTPLWNYFNANGASVCGSISDHDALIACLDGWSPGDGVIFTDDLADAYRFGWAPQFYSATLPDNSESERRELPPGLHPDGILVLPRLRPLQVHPRPG